MCATFAAGAADIRALLQRGDHAAALAAAGAALKAQPNDYRLLTLKGLALQGLNRNSEALAALRAALKLQPGFPPALQAAAQIEYQTGDPRAAATLSRLLAVRPETPAAHAMLAVLAFEARDCPRGARHVEAAGPEALNNPLLRWQYGGCLFQMDRVREAGEQFRALLAGHDRDAVRFNLALAEHQLQRPAEAIRLLEPLARRVPPDPDVLGLLASAYQANQQIPEALALLQRAIEAAPRNEGHYLDLAALALEHNSLPVGLEVTAAGLANLPQSARLHAMRGVLQARSGQPEAAEESFQAAARLDPRADFGPLGRAVTLLELNAPQEAARILQEQLVRTPKSARVRIVLAQALLRTPENTAQAKKLLREALAQSPNDPEAHRLLAKTLTQEQAFAQAIPHLEAALRIDPQDKTAAYQLLTAYRRTGRTQLIPALEQKVRRLLDGERDAEAQSGRYRLVHAPTGKRDPQP
jgi:tetratricopeptide (TPR) repeat protein